MDEQWTCGNGLAANASLPSIFADILFAIAENLEVHMETLDLLDEASKLEFDAHENLIRMHRNLASGLQSLAQEMQGYYKLPMGRHNERKMANPKIIEAVEQLIDLERSLSSLLESRHKQHQLIVSSEHTV